MASHFVIFDTEYTTWEGAMDRHWSGDDEYRELVQISAIKVDQATFDEVEQLDLLIVPQFNPVLSDFFTQLTGITNKELQEKGVNFSQAMARFFAFCDGLRVYSYGNDAMILGENIGYYKATDLFPGLICFNNWAHYFHAADSKAKSVNSGRLASHFGVEMQTSGQEHNALYDCRSQLAAFKYLYQKGHIFPF